MVTMNLNCHEHTQNCSNETFPSRRPRRIRQRRRSPCARLLQGGSLTQNHILGRTQNRTRNRSSSTHQRT